MPSQMPQALPERVTRTDNLPVLLLPAGKDVYEELAASVQLQAPSIQQQQLHAPVASAVAAAISLQHASATHMPEDSSALPVHSQPDDVHAAVTAAADGGSSRSSSHASASVSSDSGISSSARSSGTSTRRALLSPAASAAPVHVFPEGGMTNGSVGMMRFSRGFMRFAAQLPIVPAALRVRSALPEVRSHTLTSSFMANLFWFSFPLWTDLEVTLLPAVSLEEGEGKAALVQRVQAAIARELGCGVADLNVQQKRKMVQRALKQ